MRIAPFTEPKNGLTQTITHPFPTLQGYSVKIKSYFHENTSGCFKGNCIRCIIIIIIETQFKNDLSLEWQKGVAIYGIFNDFNYEKWLLFLNQL